MMSITTDNNFFLYKVYTNKYKLVNTYALIFHSYALCTSYVLVMY